ncbi:MAG: 2-oxoacid:acceptor oxidoreductase subunit alpha [Candidatus Bathyarchaeota archaeon]|nr:MAG: 2-oxoacid:acceptor oxidoreductase subunit alpha [Candidatus Bathyarchaeota archaeon]
MTNKELNWVIGGPQGSGVDTAANIFGRACGYGGYNLFGKREYHSNIKGLHSYFHFRISEDPVGANVNDVDLLAAFDAETVVRHAQDVAANGGVILEKEDLGTKFSEIKTLPVEFLADLHKKLENRGIGETVGDLMENAQERNIQVYPVPFLDLLKEVADELAIEKLSRMIRMKNVLAVGISFSLLNYNVDLVEKAIRTVFGEKHRIADMNVLALRKAYSYARQTFGDNFRHTLERLELDEEKVFLLGYQAAALGKILGGCRLQTYYPITPAADESEYLEAHEIFALKKGNGAVLVIQTEDEIAAINMASGAALTGVRAATATSGPGFSLMVEGLSWAGNNEVPVVITYYQRGAPSTGLPTRHGQDDLRFTIHAGHGEFPRIVLASGDIKECFFDAANAFNYAEKYQMPVIHLIDKALANSTQSLPFFDLSKFKIERGNIVKYRDAQQGEYKRFKFTDSGVSPRAFLGTEGTTMWYTGDEHDETGHISEEPSNRNMMMEKRMKKLETAHIEIPLEEKLSLFGQKGAENVVVSWGSPKGAILEAMRMLQTEGFDIEFMQARMINPLPTERIEESLSRARTKITVEMNYSGQLANIVTEKTGVFMDYYILKYNGRPMTTTELHKALREAIRGEAPKRQVLNFGA